MSTSSICPYCRAPILPEENNELLCPGCATPHHADCFAENGGCTVFGCSAAPPEEPKLQLTGSEIAAGRVSPNAGASAVGYAFPVAGPPPQGLPTGTTIAPSVSASSARGRAAPPPPPGGVVQQATIPRPMAGVGSVLFGTQPIPQPTPVAPVPPAASFSFEPDPDAKNRMTFIILGVLLGAFGAHNFFAGYTKKAITQLCITVLSVGFASPMSWAWAVIDISTVDADAKGIKFRS